jgi:hypothetical protein
VLMTNSGIFSFAGATSKSSPITHATLSRSWIRIPLPIRSKFSVSGVPTTLAWKGAQVAGPTAWNGTVSNWPQWGFGGHILLWR